MSETKKEYSMRMQRERLAEATTTLRTSEGWKAWLRSRSRFHNYSWNNRMLIVCQNPTATALRGRTQWRKDFNRHLTKGARAIWILAPVFGKKKDNEDEKVIFFASRKIFDVSDTAPMEDLPEIPIAPPPSIVNGDDLEHLLAGLHTFCDEQSIKLIEEEVGPAGSYEASTKTIRLLHKQDPNQQVRVLVHELAHHFAHELDIDEGQRDNELIADSVAYMFCDQHGLDITEATAPYIEGWASGADALLLEHAAAIDTIAANLDLTDKE